MVLEVFAISSLKYWVWLSSLSGVGVATTAKLLRYFSTPEKIFLASAHEYRNIEGIKPADIINLENKNLDIANKTLTDCADIGCRIITFQDAEYPDRLRNIYDPPIILYIRGNLPMVDEEPTVVIVGTRDCTPYGSKTAENVGYQLARSGLLVVTGLARGIDSAAMRGALRGGGQVIGVIGSGLDIVYPAENKALYRDVEAQGAIISEYPPGSKPVATHFPARNRILSGISLGVAVIEAPRRSGALITAARALEQGRDVFTLPGNVDASNNEGSNKLLREGAIPFLSGEDIIEEYAELFPDKIRFHNQPHMITPDEKKGMKPDMEHRAKKEIDNISEVDYIDLDEITNKLTGDERTVANAIGTGIMLVDDVIINSGLSASSVLSALTILEIKGVAVREGSMYKLQRGL